MTQTRTAAGLPRREFIRSAGLAVGGLSLFGLSACGSDSDGGGGATGAYSGQQAVALLDQLLSAAPFHIAAAEGFFADQSLELESISYPGGTDVVRAITSDQEFGMPATLPTLIGFAKGAKDLRIVSGFFNAPQIVFLARADSSIRSLDDLEAGHKIAITGQGTVTTYFANEMVKRNDLEPDKDVEIIAVPGAPDAKTAADQGVVDVFWSAPPFSTQLVESGEYALVVDTGDLQPAWIDNTLVVRQSFIESDGEVVRSWLNALGSATELIQTDVKRAGAAWGKAINIDPAISTGALKDYKDAFTLKLDRAGIESNVKAGIALGQLSEPPALDELIVDDLIPSQFA